MAECDLSETFFLHVCFLSFSFSPSSRHSSISIPSRPPRRQSTRSLPINPPGCCLLTLVNIFTPIVLQSLEITGVRLCTGGFVVRPTTPSLLYSPRSIC